MIAMGFQNIVTGQVVAVGLSRYRAVHHRTWLRARRCQRRGAGRPGTSQSALRFPEVTMLLRYIARRIP